MANENHPDTNSKQLYAPSVAGQKAAAKRIGVSVRTIENLVKAGEFPAGVRIGRFVYWTDKIITVWQRQLFAAQDNWQP